MGVKPVGVFGAAEGVVAAGNNIRARRKNAVGSSRGGAVAVGGVFAVDDADIHTVFALDRGQHPLQMGDACRADHIADT